MTCLTLVLVWLALQVPASPAVTLDIERMATCQDSWLEWKDDPVRTRAYAARFQSAFQQKEGDAFFTPTTKTSVAGLPVKQVFPGSVGMGVGFSVMLDAPFDVTRQAIEKRLGKSLRKCDTGEGMRTCALELGEKKTLMLLGDATGQTQTTLVGCYYYYEK